MRNRLAIALLTAITIAVVIGGYAIWAIFRQVDRSAGRAPASSAVQEQRLSHGRFENVTVYAPASPPRGLVLLLSGAEGWNSDMAAIAQQLARQGAMVAGIDTRQLVENLEADQADCVFPDGDLENLSHFIQAYYRLPTYSPPIVAGKAAGAALAYAALAQAPPNTFAGAVSMDFCPILALRKPLCKSGELDFGPRLGGEGFELLPAKGLAGSWIAIEEPPVACAEAAIERFVAQVAHAELVRSTAPRGGAARSLPAYTDAFEALMRKNGPPARTMVPAPLGDLPIVVVPAQPVADPPDIIAIMLSGDGGWAGLDKEVASLLAAQGIVVVGLDSLRYFWRPRTPDGVAADLDRMIGNFVAEFGRQRVVLIGYSQGADVLPFAVNRLSGDTRRHVVLAALMGMSEHAVFEFHLSNWVTNDQSGPATLPEVNRVSGIPVLCIYGSDESDSLCPTLDPRTVTIVKLKGGHHFDGDYGALAQAILAAVRRG